MKTNTWSRGGLGPIRFTELGMGTAPLGNLYRAISDDEAHAALVAAWEGGVRLYDTAPLYGLGLAETRLNRFLRGRPRDDYVLCSKIGRLLEVSPPDRRTGIGKFFDVPSRREMFDYSYDGVMRSHEASLERLGVDRIDVLHCHDLDVFNQGSREVRDARTADFLASGIRALVSLRDQGVVRAIGAGINEVEAATTLVREADLDLILLAGRYTLLEQTALDGFLPLCEERGVGVVIGGPYNSGILATGPREGAYFNYDAAPREVIDRVAAIERVCEAHGVRLIEAALRFPLLHPAVVATIPGGQSADEVRANGEIIEADIPPALWEALKSEGLLREDAPTRDVPTGGTA